MAWTTGFGAVGFAAWSVAASAPAGVRALVGVPVLAAAVGALQARRHTCVVLAVAGKRSEGRDLLPVESDDLAASRRVSWTIARDAVVLGLAASALASLAASF
ncbi:MAG: hypothetical protein RL199_1315 [Pseudomonadota bacterium]|jgi:hypothetical protein